MMADGKIIIFAGKSRSGKTARAMQLARGFSRAIVWDIEGQWATMPGFVAVRSRRELLAAIKSRKETARKLAYICSAAGEIKAEFSFWAACAFHFANLGPCAIVAEELADVTNPAKAPPDWGLLLRRVLKRGASVFCISQRWSEADKTAIGNASEIYCFQLPRRMDMEYMTREMDGVNLVDLQQLQHLEYMHFETTTKKFEKKLLKF